MKFEMKKRILALALAGTTAFSVFGAAMSANADWWSSSHWGANDDAYYRSYQPAGDIDTSTITTPDLTEGIADTFFFAGTKAQFEATYDKDEDEYVLESDVYTAPWNASNLEAKYGDALQYMNVLEKDEGYFENVYDFAKEIGYTAYSVDADGNATPYEKDGTPATTATGHIAKSGSTAKFWKTSEWTSQNASTTTKVDAGIYFVKGDTTALEDALTLNEAIAVYQDETHVDYYFIITDVNAAWYPADAKYETNMYRVDINNSGTFGDEATNVSFLYDASHDVGTMWSAYDDLDTTDPEDFEAVMANPVEASGEIYLYDYYENFPTRMSIDEFEEAWEDEAIPALFNRYGITTLEPEDGYTMANLRGNVIYAWEDFLDEIGISDLSTNGLTRWARATIENYTYQYSGDFVIDIRNVGGLFDIYVVSSDDVDLYNFEQLVEDIMNRAPSARVETAQTSELVYLMQQYYKYTEGGYVDVIEPDTDAWGDLLVALAQAPTADDFRSSGAYDRYTNRVEDLVEQYEEAETHAAVLMAEADLYDFVTGASTRNWQGMDSNGDEDTSALGTAIDNTFFNYNWQRSYTDNDANNTVYPAEVYAGAVEVDGNLNGRNPVDTLDYGANTWALYPAADYAGSNSGAYPGVGTNVSGVNESYFWFYNVYDLAYNVFVENEYQGTLDLMAETLNEAVAALTPTTNARAADILGAEDTTGPLNDLVETDYIEAMWSDVTKITTYVNDRVSNDEIGRTGANNAEDIGVFVQAAVERQRNQEVVTRSEINSVTTARANAQAALTALRNDTENYNAAQATALETAIEDCDYIIDLYNGDLAVRGDSQTVNDVYDGKIGDKDQILKSMITDAVQAVDDAINFKNVIMGWYDSTGDGDWMYGVADTYDSDLTWGTEDPLSGPHYLNFGWAKIGNTWFYFDEEGIALKSDWLQVGNDWYYFNSNCGASIGWAKVDDKWYYFNGGCRMMTGWVKVDGNYYYLSSSGAMVTGWCQVGGKWYYLSQASNSLGQMLYSTTTPDGYQVGADGALVE